MGKITVTNLGKAYKKYPTRWARLAEWVLPFSSKRHSLHWVLQDITFEVNAGEAVGVLGVNGAGKSTLLKMITGTTHPTSGSVDIKGRVAALLELGMGFHPDFTGRQNVYMAGQLLGYSVEEISQLMPSIESFANIGEYIDQPVRMYSSGMQMRLAFSVATAQRPEVLIVDEALAVGDAAFQRKCFQRIESFREQGTTLLLVSHDIETVKKLCDHALFIKEGRIAAWGKAKTVCDEYERFLFGGNKKVAPERADKIDIVVDQARFDPELKVESEMIYGNGQAEIETTWVSDESGNKVNVIDCGVPFQFHYYVRFNETIENPIFAMMLKTREGVALFGLDSTILEILPETYQAGELVKVTFTLQNPIAPGTYYLNCSVKRKGSDKEAFLARRIDTAVVRLVSTSQTTVMTGIVDMKAEMSASIL